MKALFLSALLVLFSNISHAQSECEVVAYGGGYTEYSHEGRQYTYQIRSKGDEWSLHWYGYYGMAAVCEECEDQEHSWGLLHLLDASRPYWDAPKVSDPCDKVLRDPISALPPQALLPSYACEPLKTIQGKMVFPPKTAKEQVSLGHERLQDPPWTLRTDDLLPVYLTDELQSGELRGFGVAYEIIDPSAFNLPDNVNGLLSFEVDDNCVSLTGTVAVPLKDAESQLRGLVASFEVVLVERWPHEAELDAVANFTDKFQDAFQRIILSISSTAKQ